MTISVVHTTVGTPSASGGAVTVTIPSTTATNLLAVALMSLGSGGANPSAVTSVTLGGSAGNFSSREIQGASSGTVPLVALWACENIAGGQTSVVITMTGGTGSVGVIPYVFEISGMPTTAGGATDQAAGNTNPGSTAFSSGATPTTTEASEIWIGIGAYAAGSSKTITGPASPWTNLTASSATIGGVACGAVAGYQIVSSTGTATYSGTISTSEDWAAAVITLQGASGGTNITSTGSLAVAKPSLAGTGTVGVTGTGGLAVAKPSLAGSGTVPVNITSTGSLKIQKPALAGVAPAPAGFDTLPTTTFPDTALDGRVELLLGGTWTDITAYVIGPLDNAVPVTSGHPDESTTTTPSGIPLTLDNGARAGDPAGRFTALNPTGPYYGQLVRNVPLRFSLPEGASYFRTETDNSSYAQCPDSSGVSITGDTDIRLDLTLDNWNAGQVLACKWADTSSEGTWMLLLNEDGTLTFNFSTSGSFTDTITSTVPVPIPPLRRMCVRVTAQASSGNVAFYTSPPGLSSPTWTQLGITLSFGSLSFFNSTAPVQLGFGTDVAGETSYPGIYGKIHAFQLLSGIGGTAKASPDFTAQTPGATSFSDAQSNTWTLHGTAEISNRKYRIHAETSAWPQTWDPTGHDITVQLTASGILRRLGQNAQGQVFQSAMRRAYTRLAANIVAYWPCEDGSAATQLASGMGGPAMQFSTPPQLAGNSDFLCSNPIPTLVAGSVWTGAVPPYSGGTDNVLRFLMEVPSGGDTAAGIIARMATSGGTVAYCDLVYNSGGSLTLNLYNSANSLLGANGPVDLPTSVNGRLLRISVELQASGGNISYNIVALVPGASLAYEQAETLTSATVGQVRQVTINPGGTLASTAIGQISVQSVWDSLFDLNHDQLPDGSWTGALNAWIGESAANRFSRLCTEEGIACRIQGNADTSVAMGPQTPEAITTLLQECADADRGQIVEPRQVLGLGYRCRSSMCNQAPAVVIPYSMLMFPLYPTEDDLPVQNDVTFTQNNDGSFSEQVLDDGSPLSIGKPPDGMGRYAVSVPVNLADDSQLDDGASWALHMGTVNEPRYPAVNIDLASTEAAIASLFFDLLDLRIGDYLQVTGIPSQLPPDTIDLLVQGIAENVWIKKLSMAWACVPEQPWNTLVWNDPVWGKWDTDGSTLHTSVSSTATSMQVSTTNAASPLWTTNSGDFPFDIKMAGERMTVTGITGSSSPQTFTVVRSVNGVAKAQTASTPLSLYHPPVWSL